MRQTGLKYRCFMIIAVVMSFMVFAMPILAQEEEIMAGRMAGEQAARANVNGTLWFVAGCFGTWLGVIAAYVYQPTPPATQLLGKTPEYVAAYTDAYKAAAKQAQTSKAWMGCIANVVVSVVVGVLYAAANADSGDEVDDYWY